MLIAHRTKFPISHISLIFVIWQPYGLYSLLYYKNKYYFTRCCSHYHTTSLLIVITLCPLPQHQKPTIQEPFPDVWTREWVPVDDVPEARLGLVARTFGGLLEVAVETEHQLIARLVWSWNKYRNTLHILVL